MFNKIYKRGTILLQICLDFSICSRLFKIVMPCKIVQNGIIIQVHDIHRLTLIFVIPFVGFPERIFMTLFVGKIRQVQILRILIGYCVRNLMRILKEVPFSGKLCSDGLRCPTLSIDIDVNLYIPRVDLAWRSFRPVSVAAREESFISYGRGFLEGIQHAKSLGAQSCDLFARF